MKKVKSKARIKNEEYQMFVEEFLKEKADAEQTQNVVREKTYLEKQAEEFSNMQTELLIDDLPVSVGYSSIIGKREYQQDSIAAPVDGQIVYDDKPKFICVLSDGMGGLSGGEIASNVACKTLFDDYYKKVWKRNDVSYYDFFSYESEIINDKILDITDENGESVHAGATLIAVAIDGDDLHFLNIGDSRIFLIREQNIIQLTHDQNYLSVLIEKVNKGEINEQQAMSHPKKEALISYCGIRELKIKEINSKPLKLKTDDIIMMCSDGLYRALSRNEILEAIDNSSEDMNIAAYMLTAAVNDKNYRGQDNTSVILIKNNYIKEERLL